MNKFSFTFCFTCFLFYTGETFFIRRAGTLSKQVKQFFTHLLLSTGTIFHPQSGHLSQKAKHCIHLWQVLCYTKKKAVQIFTCGRAMQIFTDRSTYSFHRQGNADFHRQVDVFVSPTGLAFGCIHFTDRSTFSRRSSLFFPFPAEQFSFQREEKRKRGKPSFTWPFSNDPYLLQGVLTFFQTP